MEDTKDTKLPTKDTPHTKRKNKSKIKTISWRTTSFNKGKLYVNGYKYINKYKI